MNTESAIVNVEFIRFTRVNGYSYCTLIWLLREIGYTLEGQQTLVFQQVLDKSHSTVIYP